MEQVLRTDGSLNSTCGLRRLNESGNGNKLEIEGKKGRSEELEESEDRGVEGRGGIWAMETPGELVQRVV